VPLHAVGSAGTNFGVSDGSAYGLRIDNGIAYGLTGSTIHGVDQTFFGSYQPLTLNGSQLGFAIGGTERLRIDSSGRLLVGTSTSRVVGAPSPYFGSIQIETTSLVPLTVANNSNDSQPAYFLIGKSRGSIGSNTIVQNGDGIGYIGFAGADGTDLETRAASISCEVDGTPGADDMPGRLVFSTTASGSATPIERLRIDSSGQLIVAAKTDGTTNGIIYNVPYTGGQANAVSQVLQAATGTANALARINMSTVDLASTNGSFISFATSPGGGGSPVGDLTQERLRIDPVGRVGIGTSSPGATVDVIAGNDAGILIRQTTSNIGFTAGNYSELGLGAFYRSAGIRSIQRDLPTNNNSADLAFFVTTNANVYTERLRITSEGNVGIGTSSPAAALDIFGNQFFSAANPQIQFNAGGAIIRAPAANSLAFLSDSTNERLRIDSSGRLLVGTSTARTSASHTGSIQLEGTSFSTATASIISDANDSTGAYLHLGKARGGSIGSTTVVQNGDTLGQIHFTGSDGTNLINGALVSAVVDGTPGANDMPGRLVFSTTADGASSPTERMRIGSDGQVVISPRSSNTDVQLFMDSGTFNTTTGYFRLGSEEGAAIRAVNNSTFGRKKLSFYTSDAGTGIFTPTERMSISHTGAVTVVGSLSKGSGSFKIDHPLPEKAETHHLVHSFIEGPQADLIYRGNVQLANGQASVNIDAAAHMTEGTFEALCSNVCCFTTNETDWTAVRGSVEGNILTIEAQDPTSTADVCWMVIGERKDKHMIETDWTDENGRVITEPLKEPVYQDDLTTEAS
jgi:hypothetical protein